MLRIKANACVLESIKHHAQLATDVQGPREKKEHESGLLKILEKNHDSLYEVHYMKYTTSNPKVASS